MQVNVAESGTVFVGPRWLIENVNCADAGPVMARIATHGSASRRRKLARAEKSKKSGLASMVFLRLPRLCRAGRHSRATTSWKPGGRSWGCQVVQVTVDPVVRCVS